MLRNFFIQSSLALIFTLGCSLTSQAQTSDKPVKLTIERVGIPNLAFTTLTFNPWHAGQSKVISANLPSDSAESSTVSLGYSVAVKRTQEGLVWYFRSSKIIDHSVIAGKSYPVFSTMSDLGFIPLRGKPGSVFLATTVLNKETWVLKASE